MRPKGLDGNVQTPESRTCNLPRAFFYERPVLQTLQIALHVPRDPTMNAVLDDWKADDALNPSPLQDMLRRSLGSGQTSTPAQLLTTFPVGLKLLHGCAHQMKKCYFWGCTCGQHENI